ncbi:MAG: M23 family metallopeptidase [Oscillospiraceae bacterium]|nr:M23 family metallopeptidase [Oscillospiraceae bacterium]
MSNHKSNRFSGKGRYIALILCAAALGISGYVYYQNQPVSEPADTPVLSTEQIPKNQQTKPQPFTETTAPTGQPDTPTQPTAGKLAVCDPVQGEIVACFSVEALSYNQTTRDWRTHNGIDIAAEAGTSVVAAAAGEVYTVYEDERMGMTVVIRHEGGYTTRYSSLGEDVLVSPGDRVALGQAIGTVGATALMETALGDHVHFSVTKDDQPQDPEAFLGR